MGGARGWVLGKGLGARGGKRPEAGLGPWVGGEEASESYTGGLRLVRSNSVSLGVHWTNPLRGLSET